MTPTSRPPPPTPSRSTSKSWVCARSEIYLGGGGASGIDASLHNNKKSKKKSPARRLSIVVRLHLGSPCLPEPSLPLLLDFSILDRLSVPVEDFRRTAPVDPQTQFPVPHHLLLCIRSRSRRTGKCAGCVLRPRLCTSLLNSSLTGGCVSGKMCTSALSCVAVCATPAIDLNCLTVGLILPLIPSLT